MKTVSAIFALSMLSAAASAQCQPTSTNFCVTHNGSVYAINGVPQAELTLRVGTVYTFTLRNISQIHPFYLTNSNQGGAQGIGSIANVEPNNPLTGNAVITFSPTASQVGTRIYYQCAFHMNMGAKITVRFCPADVNQSGIVDMFDYMDFVASFSNLESAADFNLDGDIDFYDYLDFLAAYSTAC